MNKKEREKILEEIIRYDEDLGLYDDRYEEWLKLRRENPDEYGENPCYCGHTSHCECSDPDYKTFLESLERGTIILGDKDNGWKNFDGNN